LEKKGNSRKGQNQKKGMIGRRRLGDQKGGGRSEKSGRGEGGKNMHSVRDSGVTKVGKKKRTVSGTLNKTTIIMKSR